MSELGFLGRLLDGFGVKWVPLQDAVSIQRGRRLVRSQLEDGGEFAVFQNSMTPLGHYHEANVQPDSAFIVCAGAAGEIGYSEAAFWAADDVHFFAPPKTILSKYLYHWLLTQSPQILAQVRRASIPRLAKTVIEKLEFPIPCPDDQEKSLAIQAEIVRILDSFTELTAELTAELEARKKQYNHYRDQILTFNEGDVEWEPLENLAENLDSRRRPITSSLREPGEIPYYGASGIVDYVKGHIFDGDFLLVSEDGANLLARSTPIAFSISGKTWVNNHAHVLRFETYAARKFVEYYLNSIDLTPHISGAAQPKLNKKNLNNIRIPNPPCDEKARIVTILDKFDTLTASLSEGLPREIELRNQQYEYYRDLLLSFPKPERVAEA